MPDSLREPLRLLDGVADTLLTEVQHGLERGIAEANAWGRDAAARLKLPTASTGAKPPPAAESDAAAAREG